MEIKIPKDIHKHSETIFFGLTARQFTCSVLALGAAVGLYMGLRHIIGSETASWVCIVGAAPIAVAGFFRYNGMNFEQFAWAVVKTILRSRPRVFRSENYLYELYYKGEDKHD